MYEAVEINFSCGDAYVPVKGSGTSKPEDYRKLNRRILRDADPCPRHSSDADLKHKIWELRAQLTYHESELTRREEQCKRNRERELERQRELERERGAERRYAEAELKRYRNER